MARAAKKAALFAVMDGLMLPTASCCVCIRREGHSAQCLCEASLAKCEEFLARRRCGVRVLRLVRDDDETVRIRASVAIAADSGGDAPDSDCAIVIYAASNVAKTIGGGSPGKIRGGVIACWITVD